MGTLSMIEIVTVKYTVKPERNVFPNQYIFLRPKGLKILCLRRALRYHNSSPNHTLIPQLKPTAHAVVFTHVMSPGLTYPMLKSFRFRYI